MKIQLGRHISKIMFAGLLVAIASSTFASPMTVRCPEDGATAQKISEVDKPFIRGCDDGGTIATYFHDVSSTAEKPEKQTHTFLLVECK